jgi:hypothetical protein
MNACSLIPIVITAARPCRLIESARNPSWRRPCATNLAPAVTFTNGIHTVTKTVTSTGSAQAVTLKSEDLTTLTGGTISVSAIDGVHTANIVILGQYSGTGFTTSVDNGGGTMVTYHDPHAIA